MSIGIGSTVLGRYRLDRELGSGGMGVVWLATDMMLEQSVALKRVSFAHLPEEQATRTRERTLREARMAARLRGARHVVALYDVQLADGEVWLVMEYHPSRSLMEMITEQGSLSPVEAAGIGADVASALAHAHSVDVQHRDVTPGNVLIGDDGVVKLTDFGIAHRPGDSRLTETGVVTGTVSYLAPEVARGYEASTASDVFSLGSTLCYAVEGQPPFGTTGTQMQLLHLVSSGNIRPPEQAGELTSVLLRMLELNPSTRPDAQTLHTQLSRLAGRPDPLPPIQINIPGATTEPVVPVSDPPSKPTRSTSWRNAALRPPLAAALTAVALFAVITILALSTGGPIAGQAAPAPGATANGSGASSSAPSSKVPENIDGPARSEPIWVPKQPRTVDTCGLIRSDVLEKYGNVRTIRGAYYEGCSALISSAKDEVTVEFSMDGAGTGGSDGESVPLGGIHIVRRPATDPKSFCANEIVLSDGGVIYVRGFPSYNDETNTPDLCSIVRGATDAATHVLAQQHAVPTSPTAKGNQPLADVDACDTIDDNALRSVPGLATGQVYPGYAHWSCAVGSGSTGEPQVRINFLRMRADDLPGFGDRTMIGGRTAYVRDEEGLDNPRECYIRIDYGGGDAQRPNDVLGVEVESKRPTSANCAAAKKIAASSQTRIPG